MRTVFHRQLDALITTIAEQCALAGCAVRCATQAMLQADVALPEGVTGEYDRILHAAARAERGAFKPLALRAPVAGGERTVVGALEDMGGPALLVSEIVRRRYSPTRYPTRSESISAARPKTLINPAIHARSVI